MRLTVVLVATAVAFLALIGAAGPERADAGGIVDTCDAKIGVKENPGTPPHPIVYQTQALLAILLGAAGTNGVRDITIDAPSSMITVEGTVDADNKVEASGSGMYAGHATTATFSGRLIFWDRDHTVLKLLIGYYLIGVLGDLPGGALISYKAFCPFPPSDSFADPDLDKIPAKRHVDTMLDIEVSAQMVDPAQVMGGGTSPQGITGVPVAIRDKQGNVSVVIVPPAQLAQFLILASINGPLESLFERKHHSIKSKYGGAFSNANNLAELSFPPIIDGAGPVQRNIAGYVAGYLALTNAATVLNSFGVDISFIGESIDFLNGTAATGPWRLRPPSRGELLLNSVDDAVPQAGGGYGHGKDSSNIVSFSYNPQTARVTVQLYLLFAALNLGLQRISDAGEISPAGADEPVGDPIPFLVTITGIVAAPNNIDSQLDNCDDVANAGQADSDSDGLGDACEGVVWGDPTCNGFVGATDALDTLRDQAGAPRLPQTGCPEFGAPVGVHEFGDWNCDGAHNALDAIIILARRAGVAGPEPPGECPELGDFVATVVT